MQAWKEDDIFRGNAGPSYADIYTKGAAAPKQKVPRHRFVSASRAEGPEGWYADQTDYSDMVEINVPSNNCMVIVLSGNCCSPEFKDGDEVVIDFEATAKEGLIPGKYYYIALRGEAGEEGRMTFKQFIGQDKRTGEFVFKSTNPNEKEEVRLSGLFNAGRAVSKLL